MITIPQGGTIAGQAAQATTPQIDDTGSFIAQIGNAINTKFAAVKAKQEEIQTQRTTLDITRDIGVERQKFDQMTDPAQIEAQWPVFVAGLTDKYTNAKGPDGKPLHTPDQVAAFGLTIQDLGMRQGLALGDRAIALTQSQGSAAWSTNRLDIVNTAATADPDTMLAMIELGEKSIDQLAADTAMMPEEVAKQKQTLHYDVYNARAISIGGEDPAGLLAQLNAGEYDPLGPERVAALKVTAQNEIDRLAAAEAQTVKAAQTEQDRVIGAKLTDMTALFGKGNTVADQDLLDLPEYKASPKYGEAIAARDLAAATPGIRQMTPAQLDAAIAAEKADPKSESYQAERLTVLTKWRDDAVKGWANDGAAQAKASGLPIPEVDVTDLEHLGEGLAKQIAFSGQLAKDGHIKDPLGAVLDTTQRAAIKALTAPEADYAKKIDLARAIAAGTGGNTDPLTRTLGLDPVFAEATRVLVDTGNEALATRILSGQQKAAPGGTVVLPPKAALANIFDDVTGGVYENDPAAKARAFAAVNGLYADSASGLAAASTEASAPFLQDNEAQAAYTAAVKEYTGATPDRDGNLTVGGLQPFRDRNVMLPQGVALDEVEIAMENIDRQLKGDAFNAADGFWVAATDANGVPFQSADAADRLRGLKAASVDGRVPFWGGNDDLVSEFQIEKVPGRNDQYRFTYPVNGRSQIVGDANGVEYRFRLPALIKGASK